MGLMRFLVHTSSDVNQDDALRAYLAGPDLVPWQSENRFSSGEVRIERAISESGCLHFPWRIAPYGELCLTTATLMERERPYVLSVELARGTLNRIRNQLADWETLGLVVSDELIARLREATALFAQAATVQGQLDSAETLARDSLVAALEVAEKLTARYADQSLAFRHRQGGPLETWLGANLGQSLLDATTGKHFLTTFNSAIVPCNWRRAEANEGEYEWGVYDKQVEWCASRGLKVCGGPLLQLDNLGLPDWLCLWEGDFDNLYSVVTDYVDNVVSRYAGKMQLWLCAARITAQAALSLTEEEKLKLAVRAVEVVRERDPETPAVVSFDQPWAEYLNRSDSELSPIHIADALVRSGLGLAGVTLEINLGYTPCGSYPRSPLSFSRLIDLWSMLGLPLYLQLTLPSDGGEDPQAQSEARPMTQAARGGWTAEAQREWVEKFVPVLLAKPTVRGVFWNQFLDADPHDYPHGGLIDASGADKPALNTLGKLRKKHLA